MLGPQFHLLDYGPGHESAEPNHEERKKAHLVTVISSKFAMVGRVGVVH